jgi:hypothetical protein
MKKLLRPFLAIAFIMAMFVSNAGAQIYVNVRPSVPVYTRVAAPSPRHVWIDEEWEERGGRYVFVGGHWAEPPHPGMIWVGGFWRHSPRGEVWVRGHWDHHHH